MKQAKLNVTSQVMQAMSRFSTKKENTSKTRHPPNIEPVRNGLGADDNQAILQKRMTKKTRRRINRKKRKNNASWNPVCILNDLRPTVKFIKIPPIRDCEKNISEKYIDGEQYPHVLKERHSTCVSNKDLLKVSITVDDKNFVGFGSSYAKARQNAAQLALNYIFNKS